jgi:hypothetical protein
VTPRLLVLALVVAVAGCGNGVVKGTPPPKSSSAKVALLAAPKRPGEVIVRGEGSPESHGPLTFDGRYKVRFEQFAPEDPNVDFTTQTTFVATADNRAQEEAPGSVKLFHAARRTGSKTVALHGRLFVDVSFGDYPYVLRFTPVK